MSIRERVEQNVTIWLLGTLLVGFLAGLATYEGILAIAQLTPGSKDTKQRWTWPTKVGFAKGVPAKKYRVIMQVDGAEYSWPTDETWNAYDPMSVVTSFEVLADPGEPQPPFSEDQLRPLSIGIPANLIDIEPPQPVDFRKLSEGRGDTVVNATGGGIPDPAP